MGSLGAGGASSQVGDSKGEGGEASEGEAKTTLCADGVPGRIVSNPGGELAPSENTTEPSESRLAAGLGAAGRSVACASLAALYSSPAGHAQAVRTCEQLQQLHAVLRGCSTMSTLSPPTRLC